VCYKVAYLGSNPVIVSLLRREPLRKSFGGLNSRL
jgi:hypothetical protein